MRDLPQAQKGNSYKLAFHRNEFPFLMNRRYHTKKPKVNYLQLWELQSEFEPFFSPHRSIEKRTAALTSLNFSRVKAVIREPIFLLETV